MVLEWDAIELATADLRSLSLYRNGAKAGPIPRPLEITSTKISGLAIDTEYVFHLVLRTSAGTFSSERLKVRTHKMTDLGGITVTPGVLPAQLRTSLTSAVERIGGKLVDTVRIDTTHFVCTEGRGREWEKAVEMNIPVVRPEWVEGCEREGRIVGVRGYYLNADPRLRQVGQGVGVNRRTESQGNISRTNSTVGSPQFNSAPNTARTEEFSRLSPNPLRGQTGTPEPPPPPAKDEVIAPPSSTTDTSVSRDSESEESEEDVGKGKKSPNVQSPFDSSHKENTPLPYRSPKVEDEKSTTGDAEGFDDVKL